ncbi:MAG: hypothetical protein WDN75_18225 [Bacteroidota bacterium]
MSTKNLIAFASLILVATFIFSCTNSKKEETSPSTTSLTVPEGFASKVVADNLGKARHIAVTPKGEMYVRLAEAVDGKGTLLLGESNGAMTVKTGFGNYGGTVFRSRMVISIHHPTRKCFVISLTINSR